MTWPSLKTLKTLKWLRSPLAIVAAYFIVVGVALVVAAYLSPGIRQFLLPTPPACVPIGGLTDGVIPPSGSEPGVWERAVNTGIVGVLSNIGAVIFAIPVMRACTLTMRQQAYDGPFVRLLTVLPLVGPVSCRSFEVTWRRHSRSPRCSHFSSGRCGA